MSIVPIGGIRNRPCTPARFSSCASSMQALRRRLHDAAKHDRLVAELLERDLGKPEFLALREVERFAGFRRDEHGAAGIDEFRLRPVAHVGAKRRFVDVLGARLVRRDARDEHLVVSVVLAPGT